MIGFILLFLCTQLIANNDPVDSFHAYLFANFLVEEGKLEKAGTYFSQLLETKCSPYAYEGYFNYLYEKKDYKTLAKLLKETDSLFKTNRSVQLLHARTLAHTGNQTHTIKLYQQLHEQFPRDEQIGYELALHYINGKQHENALKTVTTILNHNTNSPKHFMLYFLQSVLYYQLNQPQLALAAIHKSLEQHPYFDKGQLWLHILQAQLTKKQMAIADTDQNTDLDTAYRLYQQSNYDKALKIVTNYLATHPNEENARILKIQILLEQKDHGTLLTLLEQWINQEPHNKVWYQFVHLLYYTDVAAPQLIQLLERINHNHPQSNAILYIADLYLRLNDQEKALTHLQKAYTIAQETEHKAYILFQQARIWYERKQWNLSIKALEQALHLRSTFAPAANLLAYCYAKTKDMPKAQHYIGQALKEQPHNPHFLETQAYCWYKQGNNQKAHSLLQQLAIQLPDDQHIQKHLKKTTLKIS